MFFNRIISVNDLLIVGIPVPIVNRSLPLGGQETSTILNVVAHSPLPNDGEQMGQDPPTRTLKEPEQL